MKKAITIILTVILFCIFSICSFAVQDKSTTYISDETKSQSASNEKQTEPTVPETTADNSQPRLMVAEYKLDKKSLSPEGKAELSVTFKNYSRTKAVRNIKLSMTEDSGDIKPQGMGTQYVAVIYAGSTYTWKIPLTASKIASVGEHKIFISADYEDKEFTAYTSTDTLIVNVAQTVKLDYDGAVIPEKVYQKDTVTVEINFMNTGKSNLRNCKANFEIKGFDSGGTLFVGEIPAGESKHGSANLRVSGELLGETDGKIIISYEDELGNTYSKKEKVSSVIEKKPAESESSEEAQEERPKYPLWWLFLIVGVIVGGFVGFIIPYSINSKKQQREDELRL